jgi:small subunit ribosomal protein S9
MNIDLGIKPRHRARLVDSLERGYASGKRKSSVATARSAFSKDESFSITVNGKDFRSYFTSIDQIAEVQKPFKAVGQNFHVIARCRGGGISGQSGALRLAISRSIVNFDPSMYESLREAGLMTVDSRVVERKKPGLRKSRKGAPTSRR